MALRWYRRDEYVDPAVGTVSQLVPDASGLQHPLPGSLMGHGVCSSSQLCRNGPTAPGPIFVYTCPHGPFLPPARPAPPGSVSLGGAACVAVRPEHKLGSQLLVINPRNRAPCCNPK